MPDALRSLWRLPLHVRASIALTIAINVAVAALYLWSRGGATTHVRVEARGTVFTAYVDGRMTATGVLTAPESGTIALTFNDELVPSLPRPSGLDSVVVTDLNDGSVLFRDDFDRIDTSMWTGTTTNLAIHEGVIDVDPAAIVEPPDERGSSSTTRVGAATITLADRPWRDYAVDLVLKNSQGIRLTVRANGTDGVAFGIRPFRHLNQGLAEVIDGTSGKPIVGPPLQLSPVETGKQLAAEALSWYPLALATALVAVALALLIQFLPITKVPARFARIREALPWEYAAMILLVAGAFSVSAFLIRSYGALMPHVPDSASYVFQAKVFASGHLAARTPGPVDSFTFFQPPMMLISGDRWFSVFPFGHPLLLAIGARVGAAWIIPPLVGAACVALTYIIGRRLFDARTGLLAAIMLAASPFFLMQTADFMSHNTAAFYLLAAFACLLFAPSRPILLGFAAGIFVGLLWNTRPLTGTVLMPWFALAAVAMLIRSDDRHRSVRVTAAMAAGALLMLGAYYLYNHATTGAWTQSGYSVTDQDHIGFNYGHTYALGLSNEVTQLTYLVLVLNGWPVYVGLLLIFLPFLSGTHHPWDWWVFGAALSVMAAYVLYQGNGVTYGPRFWYDTVPLLMLLSARGVTRAVDLTIAAAASLRRRRRLDGAPAAWPAHLLACGVTLALVGGSLWGWLLGHQDAWSVSLIPSTAKQIRGFNGVDDRIDQIVTRTPLDHPLVLVAPCPSWQCYGSVFWRNATTLDGDIVYAQTALHEFSALFAVYPDRRVYTVDYTNRTIRPFGATFASPASIATAPLARDIVLPKPAPLVVPTATPTQGPSPAATAEPPR